jgi:L-alanine-DL-glutamate epimerase-like enolase superfamily enzyme
MKVSVGVQEARLRAPFVSARRVERSVSLVRLTLTGADGVRGQGEAVALEVEVDSVLEALEGCRALLESSDGADRAQLIAAVRLPQAVAAIDLALWDLAGKRAGLPVWRLLGAQTAPGLEVNATIASEDRAGASAMAAAARAAGFRCVKVKVGLGDDAGRLAAVRAAAGREMAIRIDANGTWSPTEALASLRALEPVGIELCEEPVSGLDAIAQVASASPIPVALDESSALPGALEHRVCDAVCLKIARCGGISGVIEAAERARRAGYRMYLASTLDGPLGIAAALHAAAALKPDFACGLATLALFESPDPLHAVEGRIAAPFGPGLL